MSKKMKKLSVLFIAMLVMLMVTMPVFASEDGGGITKKVDNAMNIALTIAQSIGLAVAVILLIVVAIKYMSAAPNDKAEIKKHLVVYVVGAVLLLCATGVLQIIKSLGESVIGDDGTKVNGLMEEIKL